MLANILIALVAAIHLYILILEMFLWDTKTGRQAFNLSADFARDTRVMAANQGLYNGFLAAGLLWGLWAGESGFQLKVFFLSCVSACRSIRLDHRKQENTLRSGFARHRGAGGPVFRLTAGYDVKTARRQIRRR
ncbi:Predicted membrane protein [Raoultella terrigena]|uniref:Predicted membrane protein n=1 Tax=Raoultella terrigena TaxID=577 RepID=A0A3P8M513_RAOTE|nr:Predicted membrane protein [Raoultella terrigena]